MKKRYSILLLIMFTVFALNSYAQQINVNKETDCPGNLFYFTIPPFTLPPSTNIESYTFYVGPDTVTTTENEYSTQFGQGIYQAMAKIVLSNGTSVTTNIITVRIVPPPLPNFSIINGNTFCGNDSAVCITNTSVQTTFPISKILVDWGDAFADTTGTACHRYSFPGVFQIGLRAIDSIGCMADTSFLITIKENITPLIDWNGSVSCSGSKYTFTNNYNKGIKSYTWDFGDGQTYTATRPFNNDQLHHIDSITHYYSIDGVFSPSLSITDTNGCSVVQAKKYDPQLPLPANIVSNGKIHSTSLPPWGGQGPDEQVHCFNTTFGPVYFTPPTSSQFNFQQNWPGDALWSYDDPGSLHLNVGYNYNGEHQFKEPGMHIVKLDLSASYPNCIFYDTIELVGPSAKIENLSQGIVIAHWQKNQVSGNDTVDFVNATVNYGVKNKIRFVWNFDDNYAPACTSYSVPKAGASLPFNTATEQYDNSDHYYVRNGVTYSGKMNCRWSMDSLPRHRYTNWDTVYSWYLNGKTFPPLWGVDPIPAHSDIHFFQIPDPFLFAKGHIVLIQGNISSPTSSYSYQNQEGTIITYNGMDVLPNSTQTFYEYVFYNGVARNYNPGLSAFDSLGKGCLSSDHVTLKFGKPDVHKLHISGKQCQGGNPNGITFDLNELNNTVVLINFDSLADRKDATPCDIDGFIDYQGGVTPGGLSFPPFFSTPNFQPVPWFDGNQSRLIYHYGPNAPANRPPPADSVNGYVTIGIIIGSGCANPPFCTQAETYSDTVWLHNIIQIKTLNSQFEVEQEGKLFSKNGKVTVIPNEPHQPTIKYDAWLWGDGTMTVDSFWYASEYNLPDNTTDGYFVNGQRRVRYAFLSNDGYHNTLFDSLPFPNGLPGAKYTTDTIKGQCTNNPSTSYMIKDSAMMLLPITHTLYKSSFEISDNPESPTISHIFHLASNIKGCTQLSPKNITIGIIDSIETSNGKSNFCFGETVSMKGFSRYFRCDNQITDMFFAPNHSCATNTYYQSPYDQLNFDTLDFWNLNKNQTATIKYTYLNPATHKTDTIFYEKMFWNFGDGSPIVQGLSAKHKYTGPGLYTVSMITRDSVGGWDTCTKSIVINKPIAKIGFPLESFPPYASKTVIKCDENAILIDSSSIPYDNLTGDFIKTNYWWFGDNRDTIDWQQTNAAQVSHEYKSNGLFNIKLVVESESGCRDTAYAHLFVIGPRPSFKVISSNTGCIPFTVKLVNNADAKRKFVTPNGTTFVNDTPTSTTYFDFGDESPQIPVWNRRDTIEHTYTTGGQFSIMAYGSDAPVGLQNYCPLILFPDGLMDTAVLITVKDIATNGIVGKRKVALSEIRDYSVARTPFASYRWNIKGGLITDSNHDSSTVTVTWSTVNGNYRIVCTKNNNSCIGSDTLMVQVGTPPPLAVKETTLNNSNVSIFPNPAHNRFTVKLNTAINSPIQIGVYDMVGKNYITEFIPTGSAVEHSFDIQSLKPGIYLIEIRSANERYTYKLLVESN